MLPTDPAFACDHPPFQQYTPEAVADIIKASAKPLSCTPMELRKQSLLLAPKAAKLVGKVAKGKGAQDAKGSKGTKGNDLPFAASTPASTAPPALIYPAPLPLSYTCSIVLLLWSSACWSFRPTCCSPSVTFLSSFSTLFLLSLFRSLRGSYPLQPLSPFDLLLGFLGSLNLVILSWTVSRSFRPTSRPCLFSIPWLC